MTKTTNKQNQVFLGDLPDHLFDFVKEAGTVAVDIETTGLNWRSEIICTCQLRIPQHPGWIVKMSRDIKPLNLAVIIESKHITKIFHHAMFDLCFMAHCWSVVPNNIQCTKIMAKITRIISTSLKDLLKGLLGVSLIKDPNIRCGDWRAEVLSPEQIKYALHDVKYLIELRDVLRRPLIESSKLELAESCFNFIPSRVVLEIQGYGDVFKY